MLPRCFLGCAGIFLFDGNLMPNLRYCVTALGKIDRVMLNCRIDSAAYHAINRASAVEQLVEVS
jgi:hypothetical protein